LEVAQFGYKLSELACRVLSEDFVSRTTRTQARNALAASCHKDHGALRIALQHDRVRSNVIAVADVADLQRSQVAGPELAVDAEIEERELARPFFHLQSQPDRPDVLGFERGLLPNEFALVPGHAR